MAVILRQLKLGALKSQQVQLQYVIDNIAYRTLFQYFYTHAHTLHYPYYNTEVNKRMSLTQFQKLFSN